VTDTSKVDAIIAAAAARAQEYIAASVRPVLDPVIGEVTMGLDRVSRLEIQVRHLDGGRP
jgi:hypothetical protein